MSTAALREQSEAVVSLLGSLMRRLFTLEADDPAMELPLAQMRVCGVLMDGPRTMGAISRELAISHSAMTQIADRLERAGMVERVLEADDRRCKSLRLTPRGVEIMRSRREGRVLRALRALDRLSPSDRDAVVSALRILLDAGVVSASEGEDDSAFRIPHSEIRT
jgi:DNA-binding MarR family transcriptional regulator